jgi:4-alpha-glucanotransferase
MRHTDMLRIDHVMSLHRLYWIPKGLSAAEGAYVTYPADELYAIFCLESHRHRTMLVGENLGTVSPEVNTAMDRHGFRKMYVLQYELPPDAKRPPRLPPKRCVASVNTHDMPPFAAFWGGDDIADRARLGLIRGNKRRQQDRERVKMKQSLVKFLARRRLLKNQVQGAANVFKASLKWLVSSRAETVLINLEDLWVEQLQQNVPGTSTERPNWRRKARYTLEQIKRMPDLAGMLRDLQRSRSGGKERSPSPRPSPTGRGRRLRHGLENPKPLDIIQSRHEFSLFQRERAGARERASHPQRIQMGKG